MKHSYTRKREYTDTLDVHVLNKTVVVKVSFGTTNESFFMTKDDYNSTLDFNGDPSIDAILDIKNKFYCYPDYLWEKLEKFGLDNDRLTTVWNREGFVDPFVAINMADFNEDKLAYFYNESHLIYTIGSNKYPYSLPYYVDYIGGVTNRDFNLKEAMKILKASSLVSDINKVEIPYYNQEKNYTQAIEFLFKFPQDIYDDLCKYWIGKDKFWSCRIKESIVWDETYDKESIDLDFIGLKSAYKVKD